ncbi:histidine kinase [Nafulsella turpanensis]
MSPYFLFNSLNTLSALIHAEPGKAEQFVQEFS